MKQYGNVGVYRPAAYPKGWVAGRILFNHKDEGMMKNLLISRKFWASLLGLAVLVLPLFVPNFHLDIDTAVGLIVVVVSYVVGVAVDPGPGGWKGVVQSRKFWAAAIGLIVLILNGFGLVLPAGISADSLIGFAVLIGGYIAGVSVEAPKTTHAAMASSLGYSGVVVNSSKTTGMDK